MTKQLLQQALDALEWASDLNQVAADSFTIHDAITALRSALAQPVQPEAKPVGYVYSETIRGYLTRHAVVQKDLPNGTPLYATPQAQPAPAPVVLAWISVADRMPEKGVPVLALNSIAKHPIRACWIAKFTQEAGCEFEGDTDYCEANDEHYWPEGWYEWNRHEDTHWFAPSITHWMPMPAAPGIAPAVQPLTNGEIYTAYITATNQTLRPGDERLAFAFARAIEAAHGITGGGNG